MMRSIVVALVLAPFVSSIDEDSHGINVRVGSLIGRVVEVTDDKVFIEIAGHAGSRAGIPRERIPADTLYRIERAQVSSGDAEAWHRLAEWAGAQGLYVRQLEALGRVAEHDPARRDLIHEEARAVSTRCTSERLDKARSLLAVGELALALRHLRDTSTHFEGCVVAAESQALVAELERDLEGARERARERQRQGRVVAEGDATLMQAMKLVEKGDEHLTRARAMAGQFVRSAREAQQGLDLYVEARQRLEQVGDHSLPGEQPAEAERLGLVIHERLVDAHVELAYVALAQGNTKRAFEEAGMAAALAPNDGAVRALRAAIGGRDDS